MNDELSYGPGRPRTSADGPPPPGFEDAVTWVIREPRPKFQHNWRRHITLFVLTFLTTTFRDRVFIVLAMPIVWLWTGNAFNPFAGFDLNEFTAGLWYSVPVLSFLTAHEFGHYFACRAYDVDATLPYYIPAPMPLTGTLGAVIRIREPFPSKRALFDIGVAGPIAGFVVIVPLLLWGISLSHVAPVPTDQETIYFGEPLLWKAAEWLYFGAIPEGSDVFLHPMGVAAWWGMLATALNLLPFGQLDGGHVLYAAVGRRAAYASKITLGVVLLLAVSSSSWILMALMMAAMAFFLGFGHPRVFDEDAPLDPTRRLVAIIAFVIFVLCFTPIPMEIVGGS